MNPTAAIERRAGGTAGLVAVTESMETSGAIIWWRLAGATALANLRDAWERAGLPAEQLPQAPTDDTALRRAIKEQQATRLRASTLASGGWALVGETAVGKELSYNVRARAWLEKGALTIETSDAALERKIRSQFEWEGSRLSQGDVSGWIVGLTESLKAIGLRDTGGIYFVPREALPSWHRMVGAIRAGSSNVMFEVPALKSDEAVEAIMDAVTREAEAAAAEMADELLQGDLGARALATREARCKAITAKMGVYEQLMGRSLDSLRDRMEGIMASVVAQALARQAEDEEK